MVTIMAVRIVKIGAIQMNSRVLENEKNLSRSLELLGQASCEGGKIIVLPELCSSGNSFNNLEEVEAASEEVPRGNSTEIWTDFAKENSVYIVGGVCERLEGKYYNSAVLVSPDGFIDVYRKIHLWGEEKKWFSTGDIFKVFETPLAKIGIIICYDGFFPETVRILTEMGAEIICQPTAEMDVSELEIMRSRAYENGIFIATANIVGDDRSVHYPGHTQISNPRGKLSGFLDGESEGILLSAIDLSEISIARRQTKFNEILSDRRIDLYDRYLGYSKKSE